MFLFLYNSFPILVKVYRTELDSFTNNNGLYVHTKTSTDTYTV